MVILKLEETGLSKLEKAVVKGIVKKSEKELVKYIGLPSRENLQKTIVNTAVSTATTGLS